MPLLCALLQGGDDDKENIGSPQVQLESGNGRYPTRSSRKRKDPNGLKRDLLTNNTRFCRIDVGKLAELNGMVKTHTYDPSTE